MTNSQLTNRNNNMGVLHFIAALFVMYGHQCILLGLPAPILLGTGLQTVGVKIIFIISGYLITQSLWNMEGSYTNVIKRYLMKRLSRIYPEFIGCLLVTTFIIGPLFTNLTQTEYWRNIHYSHYITANIRMYPIYSLPGLFTQNPYPNAVNGSLWTLPVELFLYIFILLIFLASNKANRNKYIYGAVALVLICLSIMRIALFPNKSLVFYGTDWLQGLDVMPYFLIGGIARLFPVKRILSVQLGSILFILFAWVNFDVQWINELICLLVLTYFILSLALADEQYLHFRWIKSEYTYGMYLYGFVIQQCVISKVCTSMLLNKWILFTISFFFTYVLALVSYNFFYIPVHKILKKHICETIQKK